MMIDDDANVLERLKSIIDWENLPIRFVCQASDSENAKELYLLYRPKIIITDINIPIISGLELAKEMLKEDPGLQFIIITGYSDFDLVRQSLDLQAVSLLGKPILPQDINASLQKAIIRLESEHADRVSRSALQQLVANNLPQMQETFLANLLRKAPENPALIPMKIAQLQLPLIGPRLAVAVIAVHKSSLDAENREAITLLVRDKIAFSLAAIHSSIFSFTDSHMRLICVINTAEENPDNAIEELLVKVREQMKFIQDTQIFAGIGPVVSRAAELYISYSGAITALNYQCLLGNETITHYKNLERIDTTLHTQEPVYGHLRKLFRAGELEEIETTIQNHLTYLSSWGHAAQKHIKNFFFEYVTAITNEAMHMGLEMEKMGNCAALIMRLFQKTDIKTCVRDILELTEHLMKQIQAQRANNTNYLITMAKEYIQENIHDEMLNLEQVGNHVGLSRIYFCKLFHQVEGVSFNNYLKQARLDLAKKLLLTTNMKVFEISDASGFSNAKYFSYVFKQSVGLTPLEFRANR